jgi:hypothetical protein
MNNTSVPTTKGRLVSMASGARLTSDTQNELKELLEQYRGQTRIRLSRSFTIECDSPKGHVVIAVPQNAEVMLFCHMKGSYKQPSGHVSRRYVVTFYLEGGNHVSIMTDNTVKLTQASRTEYAKARMV